MTYELSSALKCLMLIGIATLPCNVIATSWQYDELYNPVDQATNYVAHVLVDDTRIALRCSAIDRKVQIRVSLPTEATVDMSEVRWRFDGPTNATFVGNWKQNLNGRELIVPREQAARFAQQLRAYQTLHLHVVRAGDDGAQFNFPLNDSSKAIGRLMAICGAITRYAPDGRDIGRISAPTST